VTYLLGSIPLEFEVGERINNVMAEYARGTNRILARDRWFIPAELGGYGLISIHSLNNGIKSSWIKRWIGETESNPDYAGEKILGGNTEVDRIGCSGMRLGSLRCIGSVNKEWNKFMKAFCMTGENVLKALIFENSAFLSDREEFMEEIVFGRGRYEEIKENVREVRVAGLISNRGCKAKDEIEITLGVRINMAEYFRLRERVEWIILNYAEIGKEGKALSELMRRKGNGCGRYREMLEGKGSRWYVEKDPRRMPSVRTLLGEDVANIDRKMLELNIGLWNTSQ